MRRLAEARLTRPVSSRVGRSAVSVGLVASPDCVECLQESSTSSGGSGVSAEHALAQSGRFEETYEWRISTTTERGIEKTARGYRAWSKTDGTWEAEVAKEAGALAAMRSLSSLQHSLFYAIGWPSDSAGTTREGGRADGGWSMSPRDPCERYLAGLWLVNESLAAGEAQQAARIVAEIGEWHAGRLQLRATAPLTRDYDTGEPIGPDWIATTVTAPGLRLASASPTCRRALEMGMIYEQITTDLTRVLGWDLVSA